MSASSQVLRAKAQAMFGKLLTVEDFQRMLACRSVSEIVSYLKTETRYREVLADVQDAHRGFLETLLRKQNFCDVMALVKYDHLLNAGWSEYLIGRWEHQQLLHAIQTMVQGRQDEFLADLPLALNTVSRIDWIRAAKANTPAELIAALGRSPFADVLSRWKNTDSRSLPLAEIGKALADTEAALQKRAVMRTHGEERRELIHLFDLITAAENVSRIYRLRHYFNQTDTALGGQLLTPLVPMSKKEHTALLELPEDELYGWFYASEGKRIPPAQRGNIADLPQRAAYYEAMHAMHYSVYPSVVVFSYLLIAEAELDDIINITEGIRYGVPTEEIIKLLVRAGR